MLTRLTALLIPLSLLCFGQLKADTPSLDSLRARADSMNAVASVMQPQASRKPIFSFDDSLAVRLLSPRLNLRTQVTASRQKNPGDYLRLVPSQFALNHAQSPLRTTIYPYGVSGDRLGTVVNDIDIRPFEHVIQPDGAVDMNDIPNISDDNIYLLPGQFGELFGASHGIATLLTRPDSPEDTRAHSAMLVDKGGDGYSQVRGKFRKQFTDGRNVLLGIGYRSGDGELAQNPDDSYHYLASVDYPLNANLSFIGDGAVYHRNGEYIVAPEIDNQLLSRTRSDRNLKAGFGLQNDSGTQRLELGYSYRRNGSSTGKLYKSNFNQFANGTFATWEGMRGNLLFHAEATGEYEKWEDGTRFKDQVNGSVLGTVAFDNNDVHTAIQAGTRYTEDFDALPTLTAVASLERVHWYLLTSIGYDEHAPSLHDRFLRYHQVPFSYIDANAYADSGNTGLQKERQVVGSLLFELGTPANAIQFTVTAGRIMDAIDWKRSLVIAGSDTIAKFSPINHDVQFGSAGVTIRQPLFSHFQFFLGAAKYWYDSDSLPEHLYHPDYNMSAGGEFHVYWPKTGVDLYAYGEIVYSGPYDAFGRTSLGQQPVANSKLSLGMRKFRFYLGTDNLFVARVQERATFIETARSISWGFTWQFID